MKIPICCTKNLETCSTGLRGGDDDNDNGPTTTARVALACVNKTVFQHERRVSQVLTVGCFAVRNRITTDTNKKNRPAISTATYARYSVAVVLVDIVGRRRRPSSLSVVVVSIANNARTYATYSLQPHAKRGCVTRPHTALTTETS